MFTTHVHTFLEVSVFQHVVLVGFQHAGPAGRQWSSQHSSTSFLSQPTSCRHALKTSGCIKEQVSVVRKHASVPMQCQHQLHHHTLFDFEAQYSQYTQFILFLTQSHSIGKTFEKMRTPVQSRHSIMVPKNVRKSGHFDNQDTFPPG